MQPGRELDALIAEKVLGWTEIPGQQSTNQFEMGLALSHWKRPDGNPVPELPHFSTDIAAAFQVLEAVKKHAEGWWRWELSQNICRWYESAQNGREGNPLTWASGTTTAHAICLAALQAIS